jgi:DNA-binding SARP family transcriptional activator
MEEFRIHLLGQPRFSLNGMPYKYTAPRTLPLLAYLLLHRDAHVTPGHRLVRAVGG